VLGAFHRSLEPSLGIGVVETNFRRGDTFKAWPEDAS
jgi:hypothetical protein